MTTNYRADIKLAKLAGMTPTPNADSTRIEVDTPEAPNERTTRWDGVRLRVARRKGLWLLVGISDATVRHPGQGFVVARDTDLKPSSPDSAALRGKRGGSYTQDPTPKTRYNADLFLAIAVHAYLSCTETGFT